MNPELLLLCTTAASIAFVHTLAGPDHYLPFVALARSRRWSLGRAITTTVCCGSGHILGSVVLGLIGLCASIHLGVLEHIENLRGDLAAWALVLVGLVYTAWGLYRANRSQARARRRSHGGAHGHDENSGVPGEPAERSAQSRSLIGWAIFLIFVVGPCEPLIPVLMYPAARESTLGMLAVVLVFALVTLVTMSLVVAFSLWGFRVVQLPNLERFRDAIAGGTITCCGLSLALLGL